MWQIFEPLWRTLSGGCAAPTPDDMPPGDAGGAALVAQLGLTAEEARDIVRTGSLEPHFTYRRYRKPKRSGGWREIAEPDPRLKRVQRQIIAHYLATEYVHPAAVAYQSGKSTANHVRPHAGSAVIVTADVRDFFPSTRAARVEAWWRERVEGEAARLLALLTTDRGALPQGAPTSPALSNLVNVGLDERLSRWATSAGAKYTRYCDDLAFSWPRGSGPRSDFERGVRAALHEFGYALHPNKGWAVYEAADEPEVTGAVLTRSGRVALPERVRQVMRKLARSADPRDAERLEGYRGYAAMLTGRPRKR